MTYKKFKCNNCNFEYKAWNKLICVCPNCNKAVNYTLDKAWTIMSGKQNKTFYSIEGHRRLRRAKQNG